MEHTEQDIVDNMGLVYKIAHFMSPSYTNNSLMDFDDLVSEGTLGLMDAFNKYDLRRGLSSQPTRASGSEVGYWMLTVSLSGRDGRVGSRDSPLLATCTWTLRRVRTPRRFMLWCRAGFSLSRI